MAWSHVAWSEIWWWLCSSSTEIKCLLINHVRKEGVYNMMWNQSQNWKFGLNDFYREASQVESRSTPKIVEKCSIHTSESVPQNIHLLWRGTFSTSKWFELIQIQGILVSTKTRTHPLFSTAYSMSVKKCGHVRDSLKYFAYEFIWQSKPNRGYLVCITLDV